MTIPSSPAVASAPAAARSAAVGLKARTSKGMFWSFVESLGDQAIQLLVAVVLARLIAPAQFGLVGMVTVVLALLKPVIDGGFGEALIQKKDCTQTDYASVFVFNLVFSLVLYGVVFAAAPLVARFYGQPELTDLLRVLGLSLPIEGGSLIQRIVLQKRLAFNLLARRTLVASVLSGAVGIVLAYQGFGAWSLVWRSLLGQVFGLILLVSMRVWRPSNDLSLESIRVLGAFGSKLLAAGFIGQMQGNFLGLVVGKCFAPAELGFLTQATAFYRAPTHLLMGTLNRVLFPALASIQDDARRLKQTYQRLLKSVMFLTVPLVLLLSAIAGPLVVFLVGDRWHQSSVYLRLMCLAALWFPMHSINLSILKVKGRSGLYLRIEILKKLIGAALVCTLFFWSLETMLTVSTAMSPLTLYVNSYFNKELIGYSFWAQLSEVKTTLAIGLVMYAVVYGASLLVTAWLPGLQVLTLGLLGAGAYAGLSFVLQREQINEALTLARLLVSRPR